MQLESETREGVLILTVQATRIDAASAVHLKNQFRDLTAEASGRVLMNLEQVTFMDSSGLGAMVAALKLLKGRKLELANLSPTVEKVFTLTRMDKVFIVHANISEALQGGDFETQQQVS